MSGKLAKTPMRWIVAVGFATMLAASASVTFAQPVENDDSLPIGEAGDETIEDEGADVSDSDFSDDDSDSDDDEDASDDSAVERLGPNDAINKTELESIPSKESDVRLRGSVFVRDETSKLDAFGAEWQNEFSIVRARASIAFRRYGWLESELEVEYSGGGAEIRDVYIRVEPFERVFLKLGRFKRPISPIAMASIWELPMIERGVLAERLTTANYRVSLNLGGRADGAMVSYHGSGTLRPELHLGLFEANLPDRAGGNDVEIADQADNLLRDVYVRGQIKPIPGFRFGGTLVGFTQARFADDLRTRVLGSLDLSLETKHLRAWLEGFAGRTPYFDGVESVGGLTGLRVLLAGRLLKPTPWIRSIDPFAVFSALDVNDEKQDNRASEFGGGVAVYFKKNLRFQLEYTNTDYDEQFPQTNFAFIDRQVIRLQFGARLR